MPSGSAASIVEQSGRDGRGGGRRRYSDRAIAGWALRRASARSRSVERVCVERISKHGRPQHPKDRASHRNLVFAEPKLLDNLVVMRARRRVVVKLRVAMSSNSGAALWLAAPLGLGLYARASWRVMTLLTHRGRRARPVVVRKRKRLTRWVARMVTGTLELPRAFAPV